MCGVGGGGAGEDGAPPLGFRTPAGRAKTPVEATETLSEVTKSVRKPSKEHVRAVGGPSNQGPGTREPGGGQWGQLARTTWQAVGALPATTLDGQCRYFLFLFVFAHELGSHPKNCRPNPRSF